jgi:hypothetical protein
VVHGVGDCLFHKNDIKAILLPISPIPYLLIPFFIVIFAKFTGALGAMLNNLQFSIFNLQ